MKKLLLLFTFSALALTSCEDEDTQGLEIDMLQGTWKIAKTEIISGVNENIVISTDIPTGCFAKSNYEFRTDYLASYTAVSGFGNNCNSVKTDGKYTYDADKKEMVITLKGDKDRKYKVVILSSSELRLVSLTDNIDQNGDLVIDIPYISFTR
ncbi:hypothetical protein ASG01_03075 [Chryseobacterium sp. Leaf180]|jgi:hypothetical protein|uniref:lipocalin family protein n=1 Tax=Chryseobacterium sp. Leaf180 TaxID=1736289 RepID=UPI0006F82456|nr:lipocalin family protein [Chryseobacterium sp. Leaf180]KQR94863.1 hypothetical protein ASG01_03075 [Chryseobacterium sp. Leaf180]